MGTSQEIKRKPIPSSYELDHLHLGDGKPSGSVSGSFISTNDEVDTKPLHGTAFGQGRRGLVQSIWTPRYLTRPVLLVFATIYAALIVALAALFGYSQYHQGLSTADEKYVYLWLYGPTAVFILIGTFWDQVIYRVKQLTPWMAMTKDFQPASKSILLDYVSTFTPMAFIGAIRNSHTAVATAVLSALVFTIIVISATGLFSLQYAVVTRQNVPFTVTTKFDFSQFDWTSVDSRAAVAAYSARSLGGIFPAGTTAKYAVQDFSSPSSTNSTLVATVSTFSAGLDCEPANFTLADYSNTTDLSVRSIDPAFILGFNATSTNCSLSNYTIPFYFNSDTSGTFKNATGDYSWGISSIELCSGSGRPRVFVSVGYIRVNMTWQCSNDTYASRGCNLSQPLNQMIKIHNSTNIVCKPRFEIAQSKVTKLQNATGITEFSSIEPISSVQGRTEDAEIFAQGVFHPFSDSSTSKFFGSSLGDLSPKVMSNSFAIMLPEFPHASREWVANKYWLSYDYLQTATKAVFSSMAAQAAVQRLAVPTKDRVFGDLITDEPRLFVRALSFAFIETGFVVLFLITLYFLISVPRPVLANDPGSIAGVATILAHSQEVAQLFRGSGHLSEKQISDLTQDHEYKLLPSQAISIRRKENGSTELRTDDHLITTEPTSKSSFISWWQPFLLGILPRLAVGALPLLYIVVLEVLFRLSESHNGLTRVGSSSWVHYGWTYIPALLMVCIHTIYQSVNFNIQVLGPYAALKRGSAPPSTSVEDHPFSRIAVHQLVTYAASSRIAVLAATLTILFAPLLTIVVSGLYTSEPYYQSITLRPVTGFNFGALSSNEYLEDINKIADIFYSRNESNPTAGETDVTMIHAVITANLSFPRYVHDEAAFPVLETTSLHDTSYNDSRFPLSGVLRASVPAIRPGLNCTIVPRDQVTITYATTNSTYNASSYLTPLTKWSGYSGRNFQGNRYCQSWSQDGTFFKQHVKSGCNMAIFNVKNNYSIEGCRIAPHVVLQPSQGAASQTFGFITPLGDPTYTYCPVMGGIFGSSTFTTVEDYTWFVCATYVDRVDTITEFRLPNYTITSVEIDETSATKIPGNATWRLLDANYNSQTVVFQGTNAAMFNLGPTGGDPNGPLSFINTTDSQNYDDFFSALVYGKYAVPAKEMLGQSNADRLISAVQHLYKVVEALQFPGSASVRPDALAAEVRSSTWNGTFHNPNDFRLVQNAVSTRILQGILAALSLCAIVTFLFMETRKVLPNNPCSIAVVSSLLAGSEMLDIIARPQREEKGKYVESTVNEVHRDPSPSWQGYFFSLGWWTLPNGVWRFGIDVGKADKTA